MPLSKPTLQAAILTGLQKSKNTPPPDNPDDTDQVQNQVLQTLSQDLADAIDAYVRAGDITGISVNVVNNANVQIGTGTQTGMTHLQ